MHGTTLQNLQRLHEEFQTLRKGKDSLLRILEESELPESVYNSNAIENSTLSLNETEKILLHQEIPPHHSQREIFEAINLGKVTEYLNEKISKQTPCSSELILLVHRTLLSHIHDGYAGRYRGENEFVRVGRHIAPPPDRLPELIGAMLLAYQEGTEHVLQRITAFHPEFERIHPFCDGNGRVGRALLNFQLKMHGYPPVIIRNKEKKKYYEALRVYDDDRSTKTFELIIAPLLKESLHKRIAYLQGDDVILLSEARWLQSRFSAQSLTNAAKAQSLPAFRERGRWKVGRKMFEEWLKSEH